jgi:REP element-mobilizing transposase RayT
MSQSLSRVLIHIIFSTKNRFAFLTDEELRKRMHAYLAQIFKEQDSKAIEIGGTEDHVHVLCLLSRKYSISELIKLAKTNSSSWAKTLGGRCGKFSWQSGYGAFSIHESQIESVQTYIQRQIEHHRRKTFQEEYLEILREYRMPYDERYLWD